MKTLQGPFHDFLLIPSQVPYADYRNFYKSDEKIRVSDDLIGYMWDTLSWIPIITPDNDFKSEIGLARWGVSIIDRSGAKIAYEIFNSWICLFMQGPDELILRGAYSFETDPNGNYERLMIKRDDILSSFNSIKSFAQKAIDGSFYVLHYGI